MTSSTPEQSPATQPVAWDVVTRQRLGVAEVAADTVESLTEGCAWSQLDPVIAQHLLAHAARLAAFLADLRTSRALAAAGVEERLAMHRLERRLEGGVELVRPRDVVVDRPASSGVVGRRVPFHGDFTVATGRRPRRPAVPLRSRPARARARSLRGALRRAAPVLAIGAAVVALSLVLRFASAPSEPAAARIAVHRQDAYLAELRGFMPAVRSSVRGDAATVVVDPAWLDRPEGRRRTDAEGAHAFLSSRGVTRMVVQLRSGQVACAYEAGTEPAWPLP